MKLKLIAFAAILFLAQSCKKSTDTGANDTPVITAVTQAAVPAPVVNTFNSRFSGATQVEWFSVRTSSSREFEVEFNHNSQRHGARFDDNGVERRHGVSCIDGPVPQVVITAFRATHQTDFVYEWKLRNDGTWRVHYFKGTVKWEATYTAAGVFIKDEIA